MKANNLHTTILRAEEIKKWNGWKIKRMLAGMNIEAVELKLTGVCCWEKTTGDKIILLLLESQEIRKESIKWMGCKKDFGETEDLLHLMVGYCSQKCKFLKTLEDKDWTQL